MENPPVFEQPTDLDRLLREAEPTWYKEGGGVRGQPLKVTEMKTQDFQRTPPIAPTSESSSRIQFTDADEIVLDTPTAASIIEGTQPFQLVAVNISTNSTPNWRIDVTYSTLGGEPPTVPSPETDLSYRFTPSVTGIIYGKIIINGTTGAITDRQLVASNTLPADTDTDFHVEIGSFTLNEGELTVANACYGPIHATICRNWFTSEAPFYGVSLICSCGCGGY